MEEFADRGLKSPDPAVSLSPLGLEVREPSCPNEKPEAQCPHFRSFPPPTSPPQPPPVCPASSRKRTPLCGLYLDIRPQGSLPTCPSTHVLTPLPLALNVCTSSPLPSRPACSTTVDPSFRAQDLLVSSVFSCCQWERSKFLNLD